MRKKLIVILFFFSQFNISSAQSEGLLFISNRDSYQNIFSALITNSYEIVHQWVHPSPVHSTGYLQYDSSLIVPLVIDNPLMPIDNKPGGRFQKLSWNNEVIWDFEFFDTLYTPHHDIEPLPNGNILVICWEVKTREEAINMGRQTIANEIWPTMIVELQPPNGDIVWEWHIWDHLIQDIDPSLPNYGIISDHPELFNINLGAPVNYSNGDWLHVNAIDYNEELDQIIFSSRHMNEVYIIDHSTTTEEAASHSGGNSGRGGDILYRWGNPMNYDRGTNEDTRIIAPHAANWINPIYPGGGNILIFNNNPESANLGHSSEVIEIQPPVNEIGEYYIGENGKYGPEDVSWSYGGDSSFFSGWQSGAVRLSNGNTLITVSQQRYIFEVDSLNNIVWDCHTGGNLGFSDYPLRTTKIEFEIFNENDFHAPIADNFELLDNFPNPFNPSTTIHYELYRDTDVKVIIYDLLGNKIKTLVNNYQYSGYKSIKWYAKNEQEHKISSGLYLYTLQVGKNVEVKKMLLLK